jgi:hypothetical protein
MEVITLRDYIEGMIRTQIQLTEDQVRTLKRAAADQGVSMAEIIRRCIDRGLADELAGRDSAYDRARALVGAFEDRRGASDVSAHHDRYLTERD